MEEMLPNTMLFSKFQEKKKNEYHEYYKSTES